MAMLFDWTNAIFLEHAPDAFIQNPSPPAGSDRGSVEYIAPPFVPRPAFLNMRYFFRVQYDLLTPAYEFFLIDLLPGGTYSLTGLSDANALGREWQLDWGFIDAQPADIPPVGVWDPAWYFRLEYSRVGFTETYIDYLQVSNYQPPSFVGTTFGWVLSWDSLPGFDHQQFDNRSALTTLDFIPALPVVSRFGVQRNISFYPGSAGWDPFELP